MKRSKTDRRNQHFPIGWVLVLAILAFTPQAWCVDNGTGHPPTMELVLGYFSGRPNPTLVVTDSVEIERIAGVLREALRTRLNAKVTFPSGGGYSGLCVNVDGPGDISGTYRIYGGVIFANTVSNCYADIGKLEEYLVNKVLDSGQTLYPLPDTKFRQSVQRALHRNR